MKVFVWKHEWGFYGTYTHAATANTEAEARGLLVERYKQKVKEIFEFDAPDEVLLTRDQKVRDANVKVPRTWYETYDLLCGPPTVVYDAEVVITGYVQFYPKEGTPDGDTTVHPGEDRRAETSAA